ncbi:hypothetical protein [Blastococcus haudaquaticus]|uniref:Uncharacterized protein n=1 Tax=Blastococcus haudaquaticus TaxID=1938745 RepID=A0A286GTP7_9ACTN|nr:hypothetical protein [Blastococcus haudaquaticus]SOD98898.1 hypothetical protein SAMN06272739_2079 [Blastococcus haudaquaticus]
MARDDMARDDTTLDRDLTDGVPEPRTDREILSPDAWPARHGSRPRSEYWDVTTARWVRRPPLPAPRRGA